MTEPAKRAEGAADADRRCGVVALLGAPNSGKSTLVNRLVGDKISIVTPKVQTTRSRVIGISVIGAAQLVLIDTPGVLAPKRRLQRAMVGAAWAGARDADIVVLLVDSARGLGGNTRGIVDGLKVRKREAVGALNKIDLVERPKLLELAAALDREGPFTALFMISALTGDGVDDLAAALAAAVPKGPWLYPEDQIADMPLRLLAAEITREKLFLQLQQEIPYSAAVETESWTERDDGSVRIDQTVLVRRDSQRMIALGKGGSRIKAIGSAARAELEGLLARRVHLFLHVKVRADWQDNPDHYRLLGLDYDA